jgi:hypothetical protein
MHGRNADFAEELMERLFIHQVPCRQYRSKIQAGET